MESPSPMEFFPEAIGRGHRLPSNHDILNNSQGAWSRRRWFDSDALLQNARDARPVHLHAPLLLAVHPLLDSLIELLKLYKTVQK